MKAPVCRIYILGILLMGLSVLGCDGSSSKEAVDDTVKELSGQKHVERMKKMKDTIQTTQDQQAERYQDLDAPPEENPSD